MQRAKYEISILSILKDKIPNGVYNISDYKIYNYNDLLNVQKVKNLIRIPTFFDIHPLSDI